MLKPLFALLLSALVVTSGCAGSGRARDETQVSALAGAWRSNVQFENGAFAAVKDLEFLYAFNGGGTMTESSNYDAAPPVPPAYGVWRAVGPSKFEAVYVFYTTRPPAKPEELPAGGWGPAGRGELVEHIDLAPDGRTFRSTITMTLFDQAGSPVEGGGRATGRGVRIGF